MKLATPLELDGVFTTFLVVVSSFAFLDLGLGLLLCDGVGGALLFDGDDG
jgi:hypothetical protein